MRFNQTAGVMVGMMALAMSGVCAAELSAEDEADVVTLTKFMEAPSIMGESKDKDFFGVFERRQNECLALEKYASQQCIPWDESVGPCGNETILLTSFYMGSLLRDRIRKTSNGSLYRAWLVVIDRYRLFCDEMKKAAVAGENYTGIPVIEEMIRQEKAGTLKARAAVIEARLFTTKNETSAANKKR